MISRIALSITTFALLTGEPVEWQPLISERAIEAIGVIDDEPGFPAMAESEMWFEASVEGFAPLLRAHVDARLVFAGTVQETKSERWWNQTLEDNPVAGAAALSQLSTHYLVWHVEQWPASYNELLPQYRSVLTALFFQAYQASSDEAGELLAAVAAFSPVSLTPPEGLPFRSDPSSVKDPELRAEYQKRVDELGRQRAIREELRRAQNVLGEYENILAGEVKILFRDADEADIRQFVEAAVEQQWDKTNLFTAIVADWPELANLLEN